MTENKKTEIDIASTVMKVVQGILTVGIPALLYDTLGQTLTVILVLILIPPMAYVISRPEIFSSKRAKIIGIAVYMVAVLALSVSALKQPTASIDITRPTSSKITAVAESKGKVIVDVEGTFSNLEKGSKIFLLSNLNNPKSGSWHLHEGYAETSDEDGTWSKRIEVNPEGEYVKENNKIEIRAIVADKNGFYNADISEIKESDDVADFVDYEVMSDLVSARIAEIESPIIIEQASIIEEVDSSKISLNVLLRNQNDDPLVISDAVLSFNEDQLKTMGSVREVTGQFTLFIGEDAVKFLTPEEEEIRARFEQDKNMITITAGMLENFEKKEAKSIRIVIDVGDANISKEDLSSLALRFKSQNGKVTDLKMLEL